MSLKRYFSLIFLFCSVLGFAQTGTLRIFGTVKNTDNNPVPGWTVTIYGDPSSRVVKLVTDRNGDYEHKIALQAATVKAIQIEVTDPCSKTPLVQRAEAKPGEERHDFVICSQSNPGGGDPCEGKFSFTVRPDGWVEFHATSGSREAKYYWDFGDGSTGEGRDIKHQYQNEGVYVVVLTIGTTTCKFVYRAKIEVKGTVPPPDPRKSSWTNSCCGRVNITGLRASTSASPNNFVFTAGADFDIKEVSWDFGDSETATGNPVKHSYANPGKYLVTTTITGEFCKVELKTWIHVGNVVNPPPTPCDIDFNWKADNLTIKVVPDFKGATPDKLSWDFGDGSTSSDEIATHTYAKAG
ncbi:MAG TPA: PKD domain-containing protein, partial [Saprospiraceae bacterium]|nr:PKD domain-containing protein [Saprospiraceae bacterium]